MPAMPASLRACRQQIHNAVIYQRMLQKFAAVSEDPPSWRQLAAVGAASGLPFVVFGVLDNGIMVGARELAVTCMLFSVGCCHSTKEQAAALIG